MILKFRHKGLERLFTHGDVSGVSDQNLRKLRHILAQLNVSREPAEMNLPGFRLHPLKGELRGQWAVCLTGNRRITFEFEGEDATNVDLIDYH